MDANHTLTDQLRAIANTVPIAYAGAFLTASGELDRTGQQPTAEQLMTLLAIIAGDLRSTGDKLATAEDTLSRARTAVHTLNNL